MVERFEGKVIAIAGGAGGIGSATSRRLAAEGALVIVGDISRDVAAETAAAIVASGGQAIAIAIDIADEESVRSFVDQAATAKGHLDGFYVNAHDGRRGEDDTDPVAIDMAVYDHMMSVNLRGYFLCTRHAVPALLKQGGCMLYTSSGGAYLAMPSKPSYAMAKNAIQGLSRHVATRFGKQGVRSNVIAPGLIFHPAVDAVMPPGIREATLASLHVPRVGVPEDIAAMAALLLSDDGAFVTGQVICVDGGVTMRA
jgi:NAD(P)-dependent dehydrogenase (short-subunit alcohol dehydrogenase family)